MQSNFYDSFLFLVPILEYAACLPKCVAYGIAQGSLKSEKYSL